MATDPGDLTFSGDPEHAPEYLVQQLARILPMDHYRTPIRTEALAKAARLGQARITADFIWKQAHLSGQVYATERQPVTMMLCSACPQKDRVLGDTLKHLSVDEPPLAPISLSVDLRGTGLELRRAGHKPSMTKKEDAAAKAAELREQAAKMREQGNHDEAQRLVVQANQVEAGEISPS